jgi:hypothetical protein
MLLFSVAVLSACSYKVTVYSFNNPRCAFLDKNGKLTYWPAGTGAVSGFKNGFAVYKTGSAAGFIGLDGTLHPRPFYFEAYSKLSDGLALVRDPKNNKFCYIDFDGNRKIETGLTLTYQQPCHPFSDGLAAVFVQSKQGASKTPLDPPSGGMTDIRDGYWGFIDKTGKFVIPPKFASASDFSGGRTRVTLADAPKKILVIDRSGKVVFKSPYDDLTNFSEDGFAIFKNKLPSGVYDRTHCGLIDRDGKVRIEHVFLENFSDGLGLLYPDSVGPLVYIDANGRKVLEISAKRRVWTLSPQPCFKDGYAAIVVKRYPQDGGKKRDLYAQDVFEFIDKTGTPLRINTDQAITTAFPFADGHAVVELRSVSSKEETVNPQFD